MGPLLGVVSVLTDIFIASTDGNHISHPFEKGTFIIFKVAFLMVIFVSSYLGRINPGSGYVQNHGDCQSPKEGTASKLAYSFGGDHNLLSNVG